MTNRLDARHRAEQAERIAATGATWQEIADQLGYRSRQAASRAVKRLGTGPCPRPWSRPVPSTTTPMRLLQRSSFTRYLTALQERDDGIALQYSKEIRSTVAERAKLFGAYAPAQAVVDVNVSTDPSAVIDRMESELLALVAQRCRNVTEGAKVTKVV